MERDFNLKVAEAIHMMRELKEPKKEEVIEANEVYSMIEIIGKLASMLEYSIAEVYDKDIRLGFTMLDETKKSLLFAKYSNVDEARENLIKKYYGSDINDYLLYRLLTEDRFTTLEDMDILNLNFKLVKEKKEKWIPVEYVQDALEEYYENERSIRYVADMGSEFMQSTYKYKTFVYDEDIEPEERCSPDELLYKCWEYLEG